MRRSRHLLALAAASLLALATAAPPAAGVTDGEPAGERHPEVVLLLMDVGGEPAFRCSATVIAPRVLLTAGHCTNNHPGEPFTGMRAFWQSDVDADAPSYPDGGGGDSVEAVAWAAHPDYETAPFVEHDVGLVELASPVPGVSETDHGTLPAVDSLDALERRRGQQDRTFTAVGYGLQRINPVFVEADRVRMIARPRLVQIDTDLTGDFSLLLTNNHATGGTCFGDSGGPNYRGESRVVAAVTSFGLNGNCAGTGGVFRLDRADVHAFVAGFLAGVR